MNAINTTYSNWEFHPLIEFTASSLASIPVASLLMYLHERCGHVFMANRLYNNANARISFTFGKASTFYCDTELSNLGKWFGSDYSNALLYAAGPIVDIISQLAITILTGSNRHAARMMLTYAIGNALYSLTPLWPARKDHQASIFFALHANDFYKVLLFGGKTVYSLLTTCSLATTGLILRNAFVDLVHRNPASNSTGELPCLV